MCHFLVRVYGAVSLQALLKALVMLWRVRLLNVLAKHVFSHRAVWSVSCLSIRIFALYISVISSIVSFFKLSPTVYLYSLLKSFVKRNISSNKSYVAFYTGSSSYCGIFFQKSTTSW